MSKAGWARGWVWAVLVWLFWTNGFSWDLYAQEPGQNPVPSSRIVGLGPARVDGPLSRTLLPPGFVETTVVDGLVLPTDFAFLPSGAILVAEKGGYEKGSELAHVRMVRDGLVLERPVVSVYSETFGDSGILGLILDPDFVHNRFFYLWYSTGTGALNWSGRSVFRLSRFYLDPISDTADPAQEQIILDGVPRKAYHGGGGLAFDGQGNLFISTGEMFDYRPAQDLGSLNGKLLRIRPTANGYTLPDDNPFLSVAGARPEIYALGLRNPFRMVYNHQTDHLYLGDVGNSTWEEINLASAGANYGWPIREGPCPIGEMEPCEMADPGFTDPLFYYQHPLPTGGSAISGLTFYQGNLFPPAYQGLLYFVDHNREFIAMLDVDHHDDPGATTPAQVGHDLNLFGQFAGFIVDIEYFDNALYTLNIGSGRLARIDYVGDRAPPSVAVSADTSLGAAPLAVTLSAQVVNPTAQDSYLYGWDLGDGSPPITTTQDILHHTYEQDGVYWVQVVVKDTRGLVSQPAQTRVDVFSGELPAILLSIQGAPKRTLYHGGDVVDYRAFRFAGVEDLDPQQPYRWRIDLHHNQHSHPILVGQPGEQGLFAISRENHDISTDLWYEFRLTMRTSSGREIEVKRALRPALTQIHLTLSPRILQGVLVVDDVRRLVPYTFDGIVGIEHQVVAPLEKLDPAGKFRFVEWVEAMEPQPVLFFTSTVDPMTVTARYELVEPSHAVFLPGVTR